MDDWYAERNEVLYGNVCPQVPGGEWKPTTVSGDTPLVDAMLPSFQLPG